MCGVPVERADDYLQRLIALGHRVAVCEQIEDPAEARKRGAKSVVRRDVVRLVTPGTITEEPLLDPGARQLPASLSRGCAPGTSLASASRRRYFDRRLRCRRAPNAGLGAALARLEPREIVVPEALLREPRFAVSLRGRQSAADPARPRRGEGASAERRLMRFLRRRDARRLRRAFAARDRRRGARRPLCRAHAARRAARAAPPSRPARRRDARNRRRDARQSRADANARGSARGLAARRDRSDRDARRRAAARRAPRRALTDADGIAARLDAVGFLRRGPRAARRVCAQRSSAAPDLARALSRLALGRGGPRDLAALARWPRAAREIAAFLARREAAFRPSSPRPAALAAARRRARTPSSRERSPTSCRSTGATAASSREAIDAELDEAREPARRKPPRRSPALQARYCRTDRDQAAQDQAQ